MVWRDMWNMVAYPEHITHVLPAISKVNINIYGTLENLMGATLDILGGID